MPTLQAGDRVSFVLREPGNFQSLLGWHNHTTGEDVLPRRRSLGQGLFRGGILTMIGWAAYASAERPGTRILGGVVLLLVLLGVHLVQAAWRGRQAARLIASLGDPPGTR